MLRTFSSNLGHVHDQVDHGMRVDQRHEIQTLLIVVVLNDSCSTPSHHFSQYLIKNSDWRTGIHVQQESDHLWVSTEGTSMKCTSATVISPLELERVGSEKNVYCLHMSPVAGRKGRRGTKVALVHHGPRILTHFVAPVKVAEWSSVPPLPLVSFTKVKHSGMFRSTVRALQSPPWAAKWM